MSAVLIVDTLLPLRVENRKALHTETRWGSLSCEAAANCQTGRRTPTPLALRACVIRRVFDSTTMGSEYAELVLFVTLGNSL